MVFNQTVSAVLTFTDREGSRWHLKAPPARSDGGGASRSLATAGRQLPPMGEKGEEVAQKEPREPLCGRAGHGK